MLTKEAAIKAEKKKNDEILANLESDKLELQKLIERKKEAEDNMLAIIKSVLDNKPTAQGNETV